MISFTTSNYVNVKVKTVDNRSYFVTPDLQATIVLKDYEMITEWIKWANSDWHSEIEA